MIFTRSESAYDSDSDSDSVASENQPLAPRTSMNLIGFLVVAVIVFNYYFLDTHNVSDNLALNILFRQQMLRVRRRSFGKQMCLGFRREGRDEGVGGKVAMVIYMNKTLIQE